MPSITSSVQFSSVAQSCPTLCDPMDCSTPGFPVHHQLPELAQIHVHQVDDAIQPSHPLSSPSPPPSIFSSIRVFSHELVLWIRWPKYWSFSFSISPSNEYSGLISFRIDCFDLHHLLEYSQVFLWLAPNLFPNYNLCTSTHSSFPPRTLSFPPSLAHGLLWLTLGCLQVKYYLILLLTDSGTRPWSCMPHKHFLA